MTAAQIIKTDEGFSIMATITVKDGLFKTRTIKIKTSAKLEEIYPETNSAKMTIDLDVQ